MANTINYAKSYINMLDSVYKLNSTTAGLEASPNMFKTSDISANSIYIKKMSSDALADYSRAGGYVGGDQTIEWEAHTFSIDRGRKYVLDAMDAEEAYLQAAELAAEIYRTKVIPEVDAYRFSKLVTLGGVDVAADLTYDTAVTSLDTAIATMDDNEVQAEGRILFVSNNYYKLLKQSGEFFNIRTGTQTVLNRNIEVFDSMPIVRVPTARFKTAFTFLDGTSQGETAGGFTPSQAAKDINFMIVSKEAAIGVLKHIAPKIISPENNQNSDGWIYAFRVYHDLFVLDNKVDGVYVHTKA